MEKVLDKVFGLFDRLKGDKVIWIVFLGLTLFSFVAIFSSTSLKITNESTTRFNIFWGQFIIDIACIGGVILLTYSKIGFIRAASSLGFLASMVMLIKLLLSSNLREVSFFGIALQPYEFTKIFMVLYLSWATDQLHEGKLTFLKRLATAFPALKFLEKDFYSSWFFLFIPISLVTVCIMQGGFSSSIVCLLISIVTCFIGKVPWRQVLCFIAIMFALILATYGLWKITGWNELGKRWSTVEARIERTLTHQDASTITNDYLRREAMDINRQKEGAKIAVKEGGLIGKGPGKSTQKYAVADMYGDYMFCFICEEYGLLRGALPLLVGYLSLLAHGALIAKRCQQHFSRTAVAGLVILITGQAFMHMFVNVGIGPLTGQTLPLVSYGKSSYMAFSIAFGVLLCVSRMTEDSQEEALEGPVDTTSSVDNQ